MAADQGPWFEFWGCPACASSSTYGIVPECPRFAKCCAGGTLNVPRMQHKSGAVMDSQMLDASLHERRRARRMQDPEYRAAYEQAARELAQTDAVIRELDSLRADLGISKAELARRVNRNASSVRRLFTASQMRPELPLVVALADALGADVRVVPRKAKARPLTGSNGQRRVTVTT
jgi:ribosome-binding protein aMBF1 (putative translation factor)